MPGIVGRQRRELEQLAEAQDCVERCAQLVAHAREELGLGGAGALGVFLGLRQRLRALRDALLEAGVERGEFVLLPPGLADVLHRADRVQRPAVFAVVRLALLDDPLDAAIGHQQPVLDAVGLARAQRLRVRRVDLAAVLGVHAGEEGLVRRREARRVDLEQRVDLVGPVQMPARQVQVPRTEACDLLRAAQPPFAVLEPTPLRVDLRQRRDFGAAVEAGRHPGQRPPVAVDDEVRRAAHRDGAAVAVARAQVGLRRLAGEHRAVQFARGLGVVPEAGVQRPAEHLRDRVVAPQREPGRVDVDQAPVEVGDHGRGLRALQDLPGRRDQVGRRRGRGVGGGRNGFAGVGHGWGSVRNRALRAGA